jgi:hypothetical protein
MEIENKKCEANQESSQAVVGALQSMAQAMEVLGQSLANNLPH